MFGASFSVCGCLCTYSAWKLDKRQERMKHYHTFCYTKAVNSPCNVKPFFVPYDPNNDKFISIFCFSSPINPYCIFVCLFVYLLAHIFSCLRSISLSICPPNCTMSAELWFGGSWKTSSFHLCLFSFCKGTYLIYIYTFVQLRFLVWGYTHIASLSLSSSSA